MKFKIEQSKEKISSNAGLSLVGAMLRDLRLDRRVNHIPANWDRKPEISNADMIRSYVGLLCQGRLAYEDIELYRNDPFFRDSLGITKVPSASALRQRFDAAAGRFDPILKEINLKLLERCQVTELPAESGRYLPLDIDVSPLDNSQSHKEGVSRTYKGHDGYAPIFAYIGAEGHLLNCQLRPGKQHSQKGTPGFLLETLGYIEDLYPGRDVLARLDSGFDSVENLAILHGRVDYLIKRNLRSESIDEWLEIAMTYGAAEQPRDGKTVYRGDYYRAVPGHDKLCRVVFEVTCRETKADGQQLLIPEVEVDTWWTSLSDPAETVIGLYHDHGTSEQFHSELKTGMDVERLPSGKFKTNASVLLMGMIGFNILRRIGQDLIRGAVDLPYKVKVFRKRLRKVLQDIIYLACKYVSTGRTKKIKIGAGSPWFNPFRRLYLSFC